MTKKVDDLLEDLEEKAKEVTIPRDIDSLQKEVVRLRKILESYGIEDEMHITNVEYICQKAIDDIKILTMNGGMDSDQAKVFDTMHKNLRMARGNVAKKEAPGKVSSEAELLRIVNGKDK